MKQTFDLFAIDSAAEETVSEVRAVKSDPAAALVLNSDGVFMNGNVALAETQSRLERSSRRSR
ncbi:MAG TPA: hypothetical protein VKF60_15875 [Myxococcota bacterium]|nr:hypothetical protein [Myxococcota bacterium]